MVSDSSESESTKVLDLLRRAIPETRQLIEGLTDGEWSASTPCPDWTVLDVVEHLVSGLAQFADVGAGEEFDPSHRSSVSPVDALAAFDEAAGRMLTTWSDPTVADRLHSMPWGDTPGATLIGFMVAEQLAHGWDLARATGQGPTYNTELVTEALAMSEVNDDPSIRVPGMFGPIVTVGEDRPAIDRLAGFLGRDPYWSPPVRPDGQR
ncbi:MAG: TIGR03086 family metal-binding protein [Actinomycetota bacterium]